jgi:hypothetical protein
MREIAKDVHMSFSVIGKIIRENNGQTEPRPEKLITTKAFQLFEKGMNLVQVTMELDLNPTEAEKIQQSYLRQKGLDEIVKYSETVKKYLSSFIDFVTACEKHTPESQKLVEIFNLLKVIDGLKTERLNLECWCRFYERLLNKLKQEVKEIEQRIEKLKQHEYNKWYELFGNAYSNNQYSEQ